MKLRSLRLNVLCLASAIVAALGVSVVAPADAAGLLPTPPGTPTAVAGNTTATVNWTAPSSMGTGIFLRYEVATAGGVTRCTTTSRTSLTCTATGLTNGTAYSFYVRAVTTTGNGEWSSASNVVTPGTPPSAPTNVVATGGDREATVSWDAPSSMGTGTFVRYEVSTAGGAHQCTSTAVAVLECTVTGLTNGTTYAFFVRTVTSDGASDWSQRSNFVTPGTPPSAPTNVVATGGDAQATVSWDAPADLGTGTFVRYEVSTAGGAYQCTSSQEAVLECTVTGLTNGTTYAFFVRTVTSDGASDWSQRSNFVTPSKTVTPPSAPTNVVATGGDAQATVSWDAPADLGTGTFVRYEVSTAGGAYQCASIQEAVLECTVTGLTNGTTYAFFVRTVTSDGASDWSQRSNFVTPSKTVTLPSAPTNVVATAGDGRATITWDAPSMGTGAFVRYEVASAGPVQRCSSTTESVRTCTATGLTNGTSYSFTVRAVTSDGTGPWSSASNAVTPTAATVSTLPSAPTNVVATAGDGRATITWDAPSMGTGTFVRYEVASAGPVQRCSSTTESVRTCTATGLTNGTSYSFTVRAVTSDGTGPWSSPASAVTPAAPTSTPTPTPAPTSATPGKTFYGTSGADVIYGTDGDDVIYGLGGNDTIYGLGGNDILVGGRGNDVLDGGAGADVLLGRAGRDLLIARDGVADRVINGGRGIDRVRRDTVDPRVRRVP